jgi:hypothetical protein
MPCGERPTGIEWIRRFSLHVDHAHAVDPADVTHSSFPSRRAAHAVRSARHGDGVDHPELVLVEHGDRVRHAIAEQQAAAVPMGRKLCGALPVTIRFSSLPEAASCTATASDPVSRRGGAVARRDPDPRGCRPVVAVQRTRWLEVDGRDLVAVLTVT